jgi:hypothetical protein
MSLCLPRSTGVSSFTYSVVRVVSGGSNSIEESPVV